MFKKVRHTVPAKYAISTIEATALVWLSITKRCMVAAWREEEGKRRRDEEVGGGEMRREKRRRRKGREGRKEGREEGGKEREAQVLRNIERGKREGERENIIRHVEGKVTCLACSSISISSGDHSSTCCKQIHKMTSNSIQS